jgi:hypothetical protein
MTYAYSGPPIFGPDPTDKELYELMLIGLRFQRILPAGMPETRVLLGHMANGAFIALEWLGVLTKASRVALSTNPGFVGLVYSRCEVVRYQDTFTRPKQRKNIQEVKKDLFVPIKENEAFAHGLLVAPQGYRLYVSGAGVARVDQELRAKYPLLTPEVFRPAWAYYRRQVRRADIHQTRRQRVQESPDGTAE